MELIDDHRNEVYRGMYDGKLCIFKYQDDENSKEAEIMKFLYGKIPGIPIVYHHSLFQISPSGRNFYQLIIMSELEGKVMIYSKPKDERYIDLREIPVENRKNIVKSLINMIADLNSHGFIYSDDLFGNVIISHDYQPFLIDFQCHSINEKSQFPEYPIEASDTFILLNLLRYAFNFKFPEKWQFIKPIDLLMVEPLIN